MFSVTRLKSNQRGFSLLQTLVALGIFLVASTATIGLFVRSIGATHNAKCYTEAIHIANAQIEAIKNTDSAYITTDFPNGVSQPVAVEICHNGESRGVIQLALSAHLAHGDTLGLCNPGDDAEGVWLPEGATWTVTYPNGTSVDPLVITVTVSWPVEGTTKSIKLTTEVTSL